MKLTDYIWEIMDIGKANDADLGVARDMFTANCDKGRPVEGQPWYEGADVDFAALGAEWQAMSGEERTAQRNAYTRVVSGHYKALVDARAAGDREGFRAIVADGE